MKIKSFLSLLLVSILIFSAVSSAWAVRGVLATEGDILRLKRDLLEGKLKIGQTRLSNVQENYGDAATINETNSRVTYEYSDIKITFDKERYWKKWEYDSFKDPVYTDDVDDLRFDLESLELVGDNITFSKIRSSYGEPTESKETVEDKGISIYYYGDIKLTFENFIKMRSWKGRNLDKAVSEGILGSASLQSLADERPAEAIPEIPPLPEPETEGSPEEIL